MKWCWNSEQHVAIAVSGGVDSMVLLNKVRTSERYQTLSILHVNHGLRMESDREQQMIETYAKKHGINCFVEKIPTDYFDSSRSIQHDARDYRYQFFDRIMQEHQLDILLTAHHQDDQVETILFRLLTKRFYTQRLSIKDTARAHYTICRPMIQMTKSAIMTYAQEHHIVYSEDSTNSSTKYTRNAIRHELVPAIDAIRNISSEALLDFADWHDDVLDLINDRVRAYRSTIQETKSGFIFDRKQFNEQQQLVRRGILVQLFEEAVGSHLALPLSYLDEIIRISADDTPQASFPIHSTWHLHIAYGQLILQRTQPQDEYLEIQSPGKYQFNNYTIELSQPTSEIIVVRLARPHDKIKIGAHHQKVNRIMINGKVPAPIRNRLPIIEVDGTIVAVGTLKRNEHPINDILLIKGEE